MALTNLNNHLTAAQVTAAQDAITSLETALATINVNLTAEDRQRYGSINEQNKLFVNKVADYHKTNPSCKLRKSIGQNLITTTAARATMESFINRLDALVTKLKMLKILHDYDNFQAALVELCPH